MSPTRTPRRRRWRCTATPWPWSRPGGRCIRDRADQLTWVVDVQVPLQGWQRPFRRRWGGVAGDQPIASGPGGTGRGSAAPPHPPLADSWMAPSPAGRAQQRSGPAVTTPPTSWGRPVDRHHRPWQPALPAGRREAGPSLGTAHRQPGPLAQPPADLCRLPWAAPSAARLLIEGMVALDVSVVPTAPERSTGQLARFSVENSSGISSSRCHSVPVAATCWTGYTRG